MREMKESNIPWVGPIPKEWNVGRIKQGYDVTLGKMYAAKEQQKEDGTLENYLCAANIKWAGIDTSVHKQMYFTEKEKEQYLLNNGDAVVMEGGMAGTTCLYKGEYYPCYIQNSVHKISSKNNNSTSFFAYWMEVVCSSGYVENVCNKATIMHYTKDKVCNTPLLLIPVEEQNEIVGYLNEKCSVINSSISRHQQIIEKLEEYRKAEITRAVTKGLNPDVKMKESGIPWAGQIPEGWVVIHQKYLAHIFGRIGFRGYTQKDIVDKGEGPITLSPSNMANGKMDYLGCTYLSWDKYDESPEIQIHNNDILMVKTGSSYGKVAWVDCLPMEATINPQIVVLKNITCNPRYLFYYMQSEIYQYQVHKAVVGGTIPTLSQRAMDRYIIIIPSNINEQLDVVHYLDNYTEKIAKAVDKHNQLIAKLEEYKKSLIYNVVTGKIDCREGA